MHKRPGNPSPPTTHKRQRTTENEGKDEPTIPADNAAPTTTTSSNNAKDYTFIRENGHRRTRGARKKPVWASNLFQFEYNPAPPQPSRPLPADAIPIDNLATPVDNTRRRYQSAMFPPPLPQTIPELPAETVPMARVQPPPIMILVDVTTQPLDLVVAEATITRPKIDELTEELLADIDRRAATTPK